MTEEVITNITNELHCDLVLIIKDSEVDMFLQQINQLIASADDDGNGLLDFDEFCYIMTAQNIEKETKKQITRAFSLIDKDSDVTDH